MQSDIKNDYSLWITELLNIDYKTVIQHLIDKYGKVDGDYFTDKSCQTVNGRIINHNGLFIHHIDELDIPNLSKKWDKSFFISNDEYYSHQKADKLVYCDYFEHLILHIKIIEDIDFPYFGGARFIANVINNIYYKSDFLSNASSAFLENKYNIFLQILGYADEKGMELIFYDTSKAAKKLFRDIFGFEYSKQNLPPRGWVKLLYNNCDTTIPELKYLLTYEKWFTNIPQFPYMTAKRLNSSIEDAHYTSENRASKDILRNFIQTIPKEAFQDKHIIIVLLKLDEFTMNELLDLFPLDIWNVEYIKSVAYGLASERFYQLVRDVNIENKDELYKQVRKKIRCKTKPKWCPEYIWNIDMKG